MLPRTLEPEVMESAEEALEYDAMNHAAVNQTFVEDFLTALEVITAEDAADDPLNEDAPDEETPDDERPLTVLDAGTGTALIPIELAFSAPQVSITAVDLSSEMLKRAVVNVAQHGLVSRILLGRADIKELPFEAGTFDAVISNSIIHHLPEPAAALAEMLRVLRPGGLLFVRDLLRPATSEEVDRLVDLHAADATERQRGLLRDSLHASLTLDEIQELIAGLGLDPSVAGQTSDRHWTVVALRPRM